MRLKIGMVMVCMALVSCEDSSVSENVAESAATPIIPISLESGAWLIHGVEIVEKPVRQKSKTRAKRLFLS